MPMKCFFPLFFLLSYSLAAQPKVRGLGEYTIGRTTPDALRGMAFREDDQIFVKGTIALPCAHIRVFRAVSAELMGTSITDVCLFFYDDTLFSISCCYSDALQTAFIAAYGRGVPTPQRSVLYCESERGEPMDIRGEIWHHGDISAVVVQARGYNASCGMINESRLDIASRSVTALTSDCELGDTYQRAKEFHKVP